MTSHVSTCIEVHVHGMHPTHHPSFAQSVQARYFSVSLYALNGNSYTYRNTNNVNGAVCLPKRQFSWRVLPPLRRLPPLRHCCCSAATCGAQC